MSGSRQLRRPRAHAEGDIKVQWQYKTVKLNVTGVLKAKVDPAALDGLLNQLGQERWELVTMLLLEGEMTRDSVVAVMKRPAESVRDVSELRGACPACGYDLRGADHAACPECGWQAGDTV